MLRVAIECHHHDVTGLHRLARHARHVPVTPAEKALPVGHPAVAGHVEVGRHRPYPAHDSLERHGNDVHGVVPITVKEAYAGAEIEVPTIHGRMRARIPPGTQGRQKFRLRGQGVKDPRTGQAGDHIYTVRVVVPKTQTPAGVDAVTLLDSLYEEPVREDLPRGV